jgi:hypothetical protein
LRAQLLIGYFATVREILTLPPAATGSVSPPIVRLASFLCLCSLGKWCSSA